MIHPTPKPLAPVIPIAYARRKGGPAWRRENGMQHWRELAAEYAALRFIRPGALVPLPEDLLRPPDHRASRCPVSLKVISVKEGNP